MLVVKVRTKDDMQDYVTNMVHMLLYQEPMWHNCTATLIGGRLGFGHYTCQSTSKAGHDSRRIVVYTKGLTYTRLRHAGPSSLSENHDPASRSAPSAGPPQGDP